MAGFKNYEYIQEYGLTYKRMGVFMYLSLTVIGLVLTISKIVFNTTLLSLIRQVSFVFFAVFMMSIHINWDKMIVSFNLNEDRFEIGQMDFDYMRMNMGEEAQIALHQFMSVKMPENNNVWLIEQNGTRMDAWSKSSKDRDWRGFTFSQAKYDAYFSTNNNKTIKKS